MVELAVKYEILDAHIALVTINRPGARNAVNGDVTRGLAEAVSKSEIDDNIWAVILTGAGDKAFCAGADLKVIASGQGKELWTKDADFAGFVRSKRKKTWIAAVNGAALAGGAEIALSCDLIIACSEASFGLPEVKRGLAAVAGGLIRLPRVLPKAIALEMIATGAPISAERAYTYGMVNRLVAQKDVVNEALKLARIIVSNAPLSVFESLNIARQGDDLDEETLWQMGREANRRLNKTDDFREGPRAFVEKRQPVWKGR